MRLVRLGLMQNHHKYIGECSRCSPPCLCLVFGPSVQKRPSEPGDCRNVGCHLMFLSYRTRLLETGKGGLKVSKTRFWKTEEKLRTFCSLKLIGKQKTLGTKPHFSLVFFTERICRMCRKPSSPQKSHDLSKRIKRQRLELNAEALKLCFEFQVYHIISFKFPQ